MLKIRAEPLIAFSFSLIIFEMNDLPDPGTPLIKMTILKESDKHEDIFLSVSKPMVFTFLV